METAQKLSLLTLRAFFTALGSSLGEGGHARAAEALARHAAGAQLAGALARAHGHVWQAVEILLAGESFWDGCQVFLPDEDRQAFRDQVVRLRQNVGLTGDLARRGRQELRRARQAGLLAEGAVSAEALAPSLSQAAEPAEERTPAARLAEEFRHAEFAALATLLLSSPGARPPLLFSALGYFLRRELADNPDLRGALGLEAAPALPEGEEAVLQRMADVMAAHGRGLQEWLADTEPRPGGPPRAREPAAGAGTAAPPPKDAARRPGLWAWVGTLAVLLLPVLAVLWMIYGFAVREVRQYVGHRGPVLSLAFLPDGKRLLSGGADGTVRLWDVDSGTELRQYPGHKSGVAALAVSPDGKRFLSSDTETVRLWSLDSGKQVPLKMPAEVVTALRFTPAGPRVVCVNNAGKFMELWDVAGVRRLAFFQLDGRHVQNVALSPDGRQALTAAENVVGVWDLTQQAHLRDLQGHKALVVRAAYSPDGKRAASGGADQTVRVWDLDTGERQRAVGAGSAVVALAFDGAGERLAAGASARAGEKFDPEARPVDARPLRLWSLPTGRELAFYDGLAGAVWAVAFSPDGHWLVSGGEDAIIRLWPAPG